MTDPIIKLKYGNTNTYFVGGLLIDTDMPGTMAALRREMKARGIAPGQIRYVMATHYHPDHIGLIGELMRDGAKLLLLDHQKEFVHSSDAIFAREKSPRFVPIDGEMATVISCRESRAFLAGLGIGGEIIQTASHSPDGAALILDDGCAVVGDIEPRSFLPGYERNDALRGDWDDLIGHGAKRVFFGHANETTIG